MFSTSAMNVIQARKNYGVPTELKTRESVNATDLKGTPIKIDACFIVNKPKWDKVNNCELVSSKGNVVFQTVVFIGFGATRFFATTSTLLIEQLEDITGKQLRVFETTTIEVPEVVGQDVKVSSAKVKYHDGKEYDNVIFEDA